MNQTRNGQGYAQHEDGTWERAPRGPVPAGAVEPVVPHGGLVDLDDDTPLAPACPLRRDDEDGPCEACQ